MLSGRVPRGNPPEGYWFWALASGLSIRPRRGGGRDRAYPPHVALGDVSGRDRLAEQEALAERAAVVGQELPLFSRLDAFGERRHPQPVGKVDDGLDHAGTL